MCKWNDTSLAFEAWERGRHDMNPRAEIESSAPKRRGISPRLLQKVDTALLEKKSPREIVRILRDNGRDEPTTTQISNRSSVLKKDRTESSPYRLEDLTQIRQYFADFIITKQEQYDTIGNKQNNLARFI